MTFKLRSSAINLASIGPGSKWDGLVAVFEGAFHIFGLLLILILILILINPPALED